MEKESEYFLAEMTTRIAALETKNVEYTRSLGRVKRGEGARIFRKIVGILLEVICYALILGCIVSIFVVRQLKTDVLETLWLDKAVVTYTVEAAQKTLEIINAVFLTLQLLIGVVCIGLIFTVYLLAKVRIRNNTVRDLTGVLEKVVRETNDELKHAKQVQAYFIQWKTGNVQPPPGPSSQ